MPTIKKIKLSDIKLEERTQVRADIDQEVVSDYAELMKGGTTFPPVVLFFDGESYICADGFHRVYAASMADKRSINAEIRKGKRIDALIFALGSNREHGQRMTNEDKRHAVLMALGEPELQKLSNVALGKMCKVGETLVRGLRKEIEPQPRLERSSEPEKRIGLDGKTRSVPVRQLAPVEEIETDTEQHEMEQMARIEAAELIRCTKCGGTGLMVNPELAH